MNTDATHSNHSALMDTVYRNQRHFYDITRKYYLLGRDHALREMKLGPNQTMLEIGCGTGRNLGLAAKTFPQAQLFGLDISAQMLKTAKASLEKQGVGHHIMLKQGDATSFDPVALFDQDGFDRILISYAVSMIPGWQDVVFNSAQYLKPGGELHIVDFGQQARLPRWFKSALHAWLAKFHVEPRADLEQIMQSATQTIGGSLHMHSYYRDYAWHGTIRRG